MLQSNLSQNLKKVNHLLHLLKTPYEDNIDAQKVFHQSA
jgi:hypothetical protein